MPIWAPVNMPKKKFAMKYLRDSILNITSKPFCIIGSIDNVIEIRIAKIRYAAPYKVEKACFHQSTRNNLIASTV